MKRTDRALIIIAILILLLTLGALSRYDSIFNSSQRDGTDSIAEIVGGEGDRRVRYKNELHWQKARDNQKLVFDDAIFSGAGSKVNLKVGNSDLTVDSNTLIVLRKRELFNTMNLNYGGLKGVLAKGDKLMIESNGEIVQFSATKNTTLSIAKTGDKMTVKVKKGSAQITRNGQTQEVNSGSDLVVETKKKAEPLQFTRPARIYFYTHLDKLSVDLAWQRVSKKAIAEEDEFNIEFADQRDFQRVILKESLKGKSSLRIALPAPATYYVRVKDGDGNLSDIKTIVMARPVVPEIVSPVAEAELETPGHQPLKLKVELKPLSPGARAQIQVANNPEFNNPSVDQFTTVPEVTTAVLPDEYYIRARSIYEADALESAWSETTHISVREPLDVNRMARAGMPYEIVIPNLEYPRALYKGADQEVQNHVRQQKPFPEFFSAYMRKGYDLVVKRRNTTDLEQKMSTPEFPASWIYPGRVDVVYKMEARGISKTKPQIHRVKIVMEPPNNLKATPEGQLKWSPLLFARSYEGQLRDEERGTTTFLSQSAAHLASVKPGARYAYRVRALGRNGVPISDWSAEQKFTTPMPPPPVVEPAIAAVPEIPLPARDVAQEASNSMRIEKQRSWWDRVGGWIWAGTGFNFIMVRQTIASTADVEYKNTKAPSGFFEMGYLGKLWGAVASYKRTPGEIRVDNFPVDRRDFTWSTYSAEALRMLPFRGRILDYPVAWGLRAGMQYHEYPFLFVRASPRSLIQASNNMTSASLGFFAESIGRVKYHWSMRWQQPIKASSEGGNQFSISPVVGFDGSIGVSYLINHNIKTGLFWYGQLHDYKFNYTSATETNIGKQWLFFSNAEARIGYDF